MSVSTTDKRLSDVILEAYRRRFTVQSDYSRANAEYIAMAASIGLISTRLYGNVYSREWRPTVKGLLWLEDTFAIHIEPEEDADEGHP
jgi:hypothetical protein